MYLRSLGITLALALGLLLLLAMAFILCIPAYCLAITAPRSWLSTVRFLTNPRPLPRRRWSAAGDRAAH